MKNDATRKCRQGSGIRGTVGVSGRGAGDAPRPTAPISGSAAEVSADAPASGSRGEKSTAHCDGFVYGVEGTARPKTMKIMKRKTKRGSAWTESEQFQSQRQKPVTLEGFFTAPRPRDASAAKRGCHQDPPRSSVGD